MNGLAEKSKNPQKLTLLGTQTLTITLILHDYSFLNDSNQHACTFQCLNGWLATVLSS
ncbi:hypothetical protein HMPREF3226_01516 [Prevotella corporis]|uniref:Uncharacterized protein n=1 Tax=Prevotella corporis TaxID=28128 RepID=A0A133Q712_9BACT|nr:hypothetical protein HMPREF3226_01516 [Prevotella corporis]